MQGNCEDICDVVSGSGMEWRVRVVGGNRRMAREKRFCHRYADIALRGSGQDK